MKAHAFENAFPLEHLLPDVKDASIMEQVENNDYTIECDMIARGMVADGDPSPSQFEVNRVDALEYFKQGYEHAQAIINKKLKPYADK
jgi:hypothetical protein